MSRTRTVTVLPYAASPVNCLAPDAPGLPLSGVSMPHRRTRSALPSCITRIVSPSLMPTTRPVKSSARREVAARASRKRRLVMAHVYRLDREGPLAGGRVRQEAVIADPFATFRQRDSIILPPGDDVDHRMIHGLRRR